MNSDHYGILKFFQIQLGTPRGIPGASFEGKPGDTLELIIDENAAGGRVSGEIPCLWSLILVELLEVQQELVEKILCESSGRFCERNF